MYLITLFNENEGAKILVKCNLISYFFNMYAVEIRYII